MKELWNTAQVIFAAIGGWLGYFLGGCDGLLIALVVFVAVDYVTGVMCAISDKKLSSEVGFKGICRKVLIFLLVGIANILDVQVIGTGSVLRTAVIFFYLSNEGVSLLENAAHLGLPVPEKMKDILAQLHDRAEKGGKLSDLHKQFIGILYETQPKPLRAADAQHRPHYAPLRGGAMLGGDAGQYLLADFQTGKL